MKQTSAALTLLMAPYRAIFKRAYSKGIASAVLLTAGLAAGAAQAEDTTGLNWGTDNATTNDIPISGTAKVETSKDYFVHNLTITGSGDFTVGSGSVGPRVVVNNNMTLQNGATLTVNNGASGLIGSHNVAAKDEEGGSNFTVFDDANTTFTAERNSKVTVKSGSSIIFVNTSLTDSTVTLESGAGIGAEPGPADRSANRGVLTLDGGTYNLANTAWLYGNNVEVTEGTVLKVSGGATVQSGNKTTTDIYAKSTGSLNFAGTLNVASGGAAFLGGRNVNLLDGASINSSGTLILGDEHTKQVTIEDGSDINHVNASDHAYAGSDIVMSGGTLTLDNSTATGNAGWGLIGSKEPNTASQDFVHNLTATGGVIKVTKSQIQMQNVTLGGKVEVTIGTYIGDNASSNYADNSQINAIGEGETGVLTVADNAELTMGEGSLLTANSFNLTGGVIELQGASGDDATDTSKSGSAMIRGYGDGIMNLAGTEINIAADNAGVLRSKDINLTASSITNAGILTIAGSVSNQSGGNTLATGTIFEMTGGTLSNTGTLNLGIGSGSDTNTERFTIAGGTFSNTGANATVNVKSGSILTLTGTTTLTPTITNTGKISVASGGTIATAGSVTLGGTGTIELANGSTATLAGENVILNGILDIQSGANASVTGKVTFNGDGNSGTAVDLKVDSGENFTLATGGSLTIQDVAQTIGLTHTYGESGGTFSGGTGFDGLNSGSAGTLYLDMVGVIKDASGTAITSMTQAEAEQYVGKLKTTLGLTADSQTLINLQGITISLGQEVEDALDSGDNTISYDQVSDALASGIENDTLVNTAVKVTADNQVQGSIGQVQAEAGTTTVNVAGDSLKLNGYVSNTDESKNSNVLVQTGSDASTATVAGIKMQAGSNVSAEATGNSYIGAVTVDANENGLGTFAVAAGSNLSVVSTSTKVSDLTGTETPPLTYADVGSANAKINTVQATGTLTAKDVYAVNTNVEQDTGAIVADSLTTEKADIKGSVNVAKTIDVTVTTTGKEGTGVYNQATTAVVQAEGLKADTATLAGQTKLTTMEATNATFTGGTHTITESLEVADSLVVTNGATLSSATEGETSSTLAIDVASGIRVDGNATLAANEINTSGDVYVGADTTSESAGVTEGAGSLVVNTLNLNGNDLIVDPAFGGKFSFVGVGSFSDSQQKVDAGTLNGNAYALQNAILAIGETDEAAVSELFAQYINPENQSLGEVGDEVGSILYVAERLDVATGNKLVTDSTASVGSTGFDASKYADYDAYIGDNSVLAIAVGAASNADAAIKFADTGAQITASTSGKVVITGDYNSVDSLNLFSDGDTDTNNNGSAVTVGANGLRVETLNGLMYKTYKQGEGIGTLGIEEMSVNQDKVASAYTDASSSVRNSILSYVTGDTQWYNTKAHDINETRIHGARVDDVTTDGAGNYYWRNEDGTQGNALTDEQKANLTFVKVTVDVPADEPATRVPQTEYVVYEKANNRFLTAVREQVETTGAAAESAARMADFAGVAQVALKAGASTYEAISGRMGMGAENTSMTFANNGQGAGIWLTPIYQTSDSDGFEAQGLDYGADIDLYGIALGGDYTLANGVRVGAMFNVGSGEADGQGAGSAVSNDFDYYGFGLYAGYTVGQFSVVGDVSYTAVDNDVEANTNIDKLETSLDSSNLSLGVTGAYAFETAAGIEVTPHVGLRYSYIDIDDYSVQGKTTGVVGDYSADSLSVFSIPVGVTIASEF